MAQIDYVELPSADLAATQAFLAAAFGWGGVKYGPHYAGFTGAGLDGGIDGSPDRAEGGPLVILKTDDLVACDAAVRAAGGVITVPAYDFPGGRRFHFREPGGNVLAVWAGPAA